MDSRTAFFQQITSFIASVHNVHHDMKKTMQLHGLTAQQYEIMEYLAIEQPLTPSRISECKGISLPNTSRELRKLIEKGLCEKYDDPTDRRKQYIRLSSAGEQYMANVFAHLQTELWKLLDGSDSEELERMSAAMALLQATVFRAK